MTTTAESRGGRGKRGVRSRRAQSEQTELKLLQTATWLFAERGFHGTGIRDIADAGEVAVSAMYYYAASKDNLLEEIMRRSLGVLLAGGQAAVADFEGPAERLAALMGAHVVFHARNPKAAGVTDHEFTALRGAVHAQVLEIRDKYEDLWAGVLTDGVASGAFVDRGPTARLALLQMATGVAHWYRPRGPLSVGEVWADFATMGLSLMGARRDGADLTFESLDTKDVQTLLDRTQLAIEPRRRPKGLSRG